ncbi:FtsX-like permease family protein [Chitinophaga sp. G-6-1-13]|uniref:FtsX-like permease family protein n=1 Tax=Chitinophaga fulva TaxID=2728842 RepID=A0A848GP12_9BACT|nr:ABC transporter permease [Chitinophaga fulva]NML40144.1 FtsX-like permease family protein [Chitinophaga fulva]
MLKNYYAATLRGMIKNRLFTFVNISGLSIGLALGIIFLLFVKNELQYDRFHPNLSAIHTIMVNDTRENIIYTGQASTPALASAIRGGLPEADHVARIANGGDQLLGIGDKSTYENGLYAEPDFFNIFQFPVIAGNPVAALSDPGSIVITSRTARKFFGTDDAIGKIFQHNRARSLKVGAVIKDIPDNSNFRFDVMLPYRLIELQTPGISDRWNYNAMQTYITLKPHVNLDVFNAKLKKLVGTRYGNCTPFAYPFADSHLYNRFKNGQPAGGRIQIVQFTVIIGIFVLLLACINFMNLATARSAQRAKEVGVRKTLGATRRQIMTQFFTESVAMAFSGLIAGILLAKLSLPAMNQLLRTHLEMDLSDWKLWLFMIGLTFFTGLTAGSYPAFFLSAFRPVKVLKGPIFQSRSGGLLRKCLVTFQFMISIFLIISTLVIFRQQQYIQQLPLGYDAENLIDIPTRGNMAGQYDAMREAFLQIPGVTQVSAGNDNLVRYNGATNDLVWPGKTEDQNFMVSISQVQYDWVKTAGLSLVEGRDFSRDFGDTTGCILNETAVRKMGLKPPVTGTMLGNNMVIGVVKDFSFNDPFDTPAPLAVYLNTGTLNHIFVRLVNDGQWQQQVKQLEAAFKKTAPGYPFEFHFTSEAQERRFDGVRSTWHMISVIGTLAILISCLGLLGLAAFMAEKRTREIGIRKVFGASITRLWLMLSGELLKPVLLAFLLASPLAAWAMHLLLRNLDHHAPLSWWMFLIAGVLSVAIALLTVSYQGVKAAMTNPADSLKAE